MNKKYIISIIIIIAIVIIAAGLIIMMSSEAGKEKTLNAEKETVATSTETPTIEEDSTTAISETLESIQNVDLDNEFKTIDADLQNL